MRIFYRILMTALHQLRNKPSPGLSAGFGRRMRATSSARLRLLELDRRCRLPMIGEHLPEPESRAHRVGPHPAAMTAFLDDSRVRQPRSRVTGHIHTAAAPQRDGVGT